MRILLLLHQIFSNMCARVLKANRETHLLATCCNIKSRETLLLVGRVVVLRKYKPVCLSDVRWKWVQIEKNVCLINVPWKGVQMEKHVCLSDLPWDLVQTEERVCLSDVTWNWVPVEKHVCLSDVPWKWVQIEKHLGMSYVPWKTSANGEAIVLSDVP
jgi:hypothetical protein